MSTLVATPVGFKGRDQHGEVFGIMYEQVERLVPSAHGCKVYLHGGYMIRLRESYEEVSAIVGIGNRCK